jgi:16S rRNA processing protein RimM
VVKPQGRHGEVAVELHTDFPERFADRRRVFVLAPNGHRRELHIDDFWPHKGRIVLKFAGVDTISDAERLLDCEIQIRQDERAPLDEGENYVNDLVGCAVVTVDANGSPHREIGSVVEVTFGAGEAPLLVVRRDKQEFLIPYAQEYVAHLDIAGKRLLMRLPEGMLDLDSPLSDEEKRRQRGGER